MKVLHLFNEINYSGAELMYATAAPLFQKNDIDLIAFSTGTTSGNFVSIFEQRKIRTFHWPIDQFANSQIKKIRFYVRFYKFLKEEKIDVLHIHRSNLYFAALCSRIANIKTIKTVHNVFRNRYFTYPYGFLQRFIARNLLNVTFQTIGQSVFENELYYYHNPSVRINNWFDSKRFYPAVNNEEKKRIREEFKIAENALVIISVGGCSAIKNHVDIIHSLKLLEGKLDCIYLHLGTGKLEDEEKRLAEKLGIINQIRFLGNQNNVRDYLIASDIYVMTSKHEGLSIAAIEAMACGLPSILYNSPGLRDLIENDNTGFLVSPDPKLIAEKVLEFHNNTDLKIAKGSTAIEFVNRNFSIEKNVIQVIELYRK